MKQLMIVAIAWVLAASPAVAGPQEDAQTHLQAAAVAYKEGRFQDTLEELNKAYALDPRPELHYSIGQVYVKLDRCQDAIIAYESFLASKPSQDRADLANQAIATCKQQLAAQSQPDPGTDTGTGAPAHPPDVGTTEPPPVEQPPATAVDTRPVWWKDKLGLGLTGGGAVLTVVGLVMYSRARGKIDDAEDASTYGASQQLYDDARGQRISATILTMVGLGATGVGVWRLMQKRSEEQRGVTFVPTADGGIVTYSGGF